MSIRPTDPGPDSVGRCRARARAIAAARPGSAVVNGRFFPRTAPSTWAPIYQALRDRFPNGVQRGFVHWWIELDGRIIDGAVRQFGEPEAIATRRRDDPCYQAVARFTPDDPAIDEALDEQDDPPNLS
jgi:hypothetical protein